MDELELLLKSTVQNIKPQEVKAPEDQVDGTDGDSNSEHPALEEAIVEESEQSKNIDKILTLLDEIRDPFHGQTIPAMIGVEYQGPMYVI